LEFLDRGGLALMRSRISNVVKGDVLDGEDFVAARKFPSVQHSIDDGDGDDSVNLAKADEAAPGADGCGPTLGERSQGKRVI
jgi:hypothetical protein